ncbi:hypothetical protein EDD22DRAFT_958464 [Suillus occidentalis]|nr:hypothetical protein EDD22DRAFT_958464 [Suillus occidentalis]
MSKIKDETDIRFPSAGPSWTPPLDFIDNTPDKIDFEDATDNDPVGGSSGSTVTEPLPALPSQQPLEFKTEFHPSSGREPLHQAFDEFGINSHPEEQLPVDKMPWCPFRSRGVLLLKGLI